VPNAGDRFSTPALDCGGSPPLPTVPDQRIESLFLPSLERLAGMTEDDYKVAFRNSAIKRAKWRGLVRNTCVALGNSQIARGSEAHKRIAALLERLAASPDETIAEHARWAIARLGLPHNVPHSLPHDSPHTSD
jgi:hypothetical protein